MKRHSSKNPSYFESMDIGDKITVINRDRLKVVFVKSTNESGQVNINVDGQDRKSFEIDYDFENFPALREKFIKKIKYLILRDFSIPEFQNEDLLNTSLKLIDSLDLGYGLKLKKTKPSNVSAVVKEINKGNGEQGDVSNNPADLLPKGYLPDFIYTIYASKDGKQTPIGVFSIPFDLADEIYEINNSDDMREFFIDLAEEKLGAPIEEFSRSLTGQTNVPDSPGSFERMDSGHLSAQDVLNFYNDKSQSMDPGSQELKGLVHQVNDLIRKIHDGDTVTKEDLLATTKILPTTQKMSPVKDYRKMILLTGLEKKINAVEILFEERLKAETDESKVAVIRKQYFDLKNAVSLAKEKIDETKDIQPIISDINKLIENASDFIKK